jgi:hypothetical protein
MLAIANLQNHNLKVGNSYVICSGSVTFKPEKDLEFSNIRDLNLIIKFNDNSEKDNYSYQLKPNGTNQKSGILTLYNYKPAFGGLFQPDIKLTAGPNAISLSFSLFGVQNQAILFQYSFFVEEV